MRTLGARQRLEHLDVRLARAKQELEGDARVAAVVVHPDRVLPLHGLFEVDVLDAVARITCVGAAVGGFR